jgi:hypothetical protein
MGIHLGSVLLGFGAALVLPIASRVFRPLVVDCLAAGMGLLEEARRVVAEQMETLEDLAAEAKAKREAAALEPGGDSGSEPEAAEDESDEASGGRTRRRSAAARGTAAPKGDRSHS